MAEAIRGGGERSTEEVNGRNKMVGLTGCKSGSGECKSGDVMKAMADFRLTAQTGTTPLSLVLPSPVDS